MKRLLILLVPMLMSADTANQYTSKVNAGSVALSTLDFGYTLKGDYALGVGVGIADFGVDREPAVAGGVKYGVTDTASIVVKGYTANRNASGAGVGMVFRF